MISNVALPALYTASVASGLFLFKKRLIESSFLNQDQEPTNNRPIRTLAEKQEQMSQMFGIKPFASVLSASVKETSQIETNRKREEIIQLIGNVVWVILCGGWIALSYIITGSFFYLTYIGRFHGKSCFKFAQYFIWPFEKYVLVESFNNRGSVYSCSPAYALWALIGCNSFLFYQ